jgi:hypothetical protein
MYKFGIHLFQHFSSKFGRKTWSNGVKPKRNRAENMCARRRRAALAHRRTRTPRQVDVHRSVRCAEAHVRDVGGPWPVPCAGRPRRHAPLAAARARRLTHVVPMP